jgi:sporulation-control protein spo0M
MVCNVPVVVGKGDVTIMDLLDFSKAIDSANQNILLSKLSQNNLAPCVASWFRAYLINRSELTP